MADTLQDTETDAAYRDFLAQGELRLQCCEACGRYRNPPRFACPDCLSRDWRWGKVSGQGVIETYLWYCEPVDPRFAEVPYNVALVRLDEGPGVFSTIQDAVLDDLAVGQAVVVSIRTRDGRPTLGFVREENSR